MGYTHYFEQSKAVSDDAWDKIVADVKKVIAVAGVPLSTDADSLENMFTKTSMNINGFEEDGHETFYLAKSYSRFNFCKTARKPYDLIVTSALLIAQYHAPGFFDIRSDGDAEDWVDAMKLNAKVLGYAYHLPESIRGDSEDMLSQIEIPSAQKINPHKFDI